MPIVREWPQTTLRIPEELRRKAKAYAAIRGLTLNTLILQALTERLRKDSPNA